MTNEELMRLTLQFAFFVKRPPMGERKPPFLPPFDPPLPFEHPGSFFHSDPPPFFNHSPEDVPDFKMHPGKIRILSVLLQKDGQTQKEIAGRIGIRPPSLSEVLYKLEESGAIQRCTNEADKRQSLVYLTPQGRELAKSFLDEREKHAETVFAALSEKEKETLAALLQKLLNANQPNN